MKIKTLSFELITSLPKIWMISWEFDVYSKSSMKSMLINCWNIFIGISLWKTYHSISCELLHSLFSSNVKDSSQTEIVTILHVQMRKFKIEKYIVILRSIELVKNVLYLLVKLNFSCYSFTKEYFLNLFFLLSCDTRWKYTWWN